MNFNIEVQGGRSVRLPTKGKYCDRDIVITATGGGGGGLTDEDVAEIALQADLIAQISTELDGKIAGGGGTVIEPVIQPLEVSENGTYTPPEGVDGFAPVVVDVPVPDGYIIPSGELAITENGTHDVTQYASVNVDVEPPVAPTQEKTVEITENGTTEIVPDDGYLLSKVGVTVNVAGSGDGGGELPPGYKRVDFIQFSGNQWVDTGIIGNQTTQINASFTWENSTQRHLFGCASSDNTKSITSYMNGSWRFGNKNASKSLSTKNPMLPYSVLVNSTTISITNSLANISGVNDFETVGTLLLGGCRDADGTQPGVGITGKVFFFSLWQGDELVRKLIPVMSESGEYRFYDMVSREFFDSITSNPLSGGNL